MEAEKFKSLRVARRKVIRIGHQTIALSKKLNRRYNDGNSTRNVVAVLDSLRRRPHRKFSSLVA